MIDAITKPDMLTLAVSVILLGSVILSYGFIKYRQQKKQDREFKDFLGLMSCEDSKT